jgi:hypothetical protein
MYIIIILTNVVYISNYRIIWFILRFFLTNIISSMDN